MTELENAPVMRRILARLVDVIVSFSAAGFIGILWIDYAIDTRDSDFGLLGLIYLAALILLLVAVYEVAFVAWRGQTPGKMIFGLRVVGAQDGAPIGLGRSIFRLLPLFAAVIPAIGWIVVIVLYGWFVFDEERRGVHDRIADTKVVVAT